MRYMSQNGYLINLKFFQKLITDQLITGACAVDNGGCAHICSSSNNIASCSCYEGYRLDSNGYDCQGNFIITFISSFLKLFCRY